jgi:hypothetical protein
VGAWGRPQASLGAAQTAAIERQARATNMENSAAAHLGLPARLVNPALVCSQAALQADLRPRIAVQARRGRRQRGGGRWQPQEVAAHARAWATA